MTATKCHWVACIWTRWSTTVLLCAVAARSGVAQPAVVPAPYSVAEVLSAGGSGADPNFDAMGFNPTREPESYLPFEHVDPFTGNLLLTFTDVVLPGNGGFDLRVQRTYNSKIYADLVHFTLPEDSWAGIGWSLHLGRVLWPNPLIAGDRAVVEMPDGSRHPVYYRNSPQQPWDTITKEFGLFDSSANPPTLRLPNGVTYWFGHAGPTVIGPHATAYVTRIEDSHGNVVDVEYWAPGTASAPADAMRRITQRLGGGQKREITFAYSGGFQSVSAMTVQAGGEQRTWTYGHALSASGLGGHPKPAIDGHLKTGHFG